MRYIDESLAPGETVLARGRFPAIMWVMTWLALIVLGVIVVGIFLFVRNVIVMKTTDFAVTDRRVILKKGWLNRQTYELAVESVEGVTLHQSIWARLFGYGNVIVTGTGEAIIRFPAMANPVVFRRAIETARSEAHELRLAQEDRDALRGRPAPPAEGRDLKPRRKKRFISLFG
ncbi:PH domain-containing protein [Terricaulis sp.]|uniref:PH domain-containing protein n=1 Tax=Terricaulis sp. TaxID=2768686 RepID=UPI003784E0F8